MFVMLLLTVIAQIPQLNMSKLFSLELNDSHDPERQLLAGGCNVANNSPKYSRQVDDDDVSRLSSAIGGADNADSCDQVVSSSGGKPKY